MSTKKRLGELLLEAGVIDEAMLQSALGHQRRWGGRLGQALLDLKLASESVIVEALARKAGIEVARLSDLEPYALEQAHAKTAETLVLIQADEGVPHGRVVSVMDLARRAGLVRLAIATRADAAR